MSLLCRYFDCITQLVSLEVRVGTAMGWILAPQHTVADTAGDAEPRPAWWLQPSSHTAAHLAATKGAASAALTTQTSLTAGRGCYLHFSSPALDSPIRLDAGTVPLQTSFETPLKKLSQPCFAVMKARKPERSTFSNSAVQLPTVKDSTQKGRKTVTNLLSCERPLRTAGY